MTDPWLPGAVITLVNLAILWGTVRYAERGYVAHRNAQQATCRAVAAANRAERAAGIQSPPGSGKAADMEAVLGGGFVVMQDEAAVVFDHPADPGQVIPVLVETSYPGAIDAEIIGEMLSVTVTESSPGVLRAGEFEVHLDQFGVPRKIRRADGDGS